MCIYLFYIMNTIKKNKNFIYINMYVHMYVYISISTYLYLHTDILQKVTWNQKEVLYLNVDRTHS